MLMTAKRKELRDRFGVLLATVQEQRTAKQQRALLGADGGAEADLGVQARAVTAAGVFGWLPPDLICVVLHHLIALSPRLRCGVELQWAATQSVAHVLQALTSCSYLWRCFVEDGEVLRLEVAARGCTSLMPTNAASKTPYFDQLTLEERSRFDVRMLESALNALVCHCAGEHCRGVRRAHNESIATPQKKGTTRPPTPMLAMVLAGRRPRVKVVWPSGVVMLAAGASVNECFLALRPTDYVRPAAHASSLGYAFGNNVVGSLVSLRDEAPEVFNPNTELRPVRRIEVCQRDTKCRAIVEEVATSPCGQWVALLKEVLNADGTRAEQKRAKLELWQFDTIGNAAVPQLRGSLSSAEAHVHCMWFAVGEPYNLCFIAYRANRYGEQPNSPSFPYTPHRNGVYQFGVAGEFAEVCARAEQGVCFMRTNPNDDSADSPSLRPTLEAAVHETDGFAAPSADQGLAYSVLLHVAVAASGRCVAGIVMGSTVRWNLTRPPTWTLHPATQVVFYECPLTFDNNANHATTSTSNGWVRNPFVSAITQPLLERDVGFPAPKLVELSPCGDVAVVMLQAPNGEFFVQVHLRVSPTTGFTMVRRLRLEDALHSPLNTSTASSTVPPRRHVRTMPSASVFSPCGRFLLVAFAFNEDNVMAAMRSCKPGLCVFDLADVWVDLQKVMAKASCSNRPELLQDGCSVAWIECRADLLPREMAWNPAGLWLLTRSGVVLLGL